jgi:hypothetical protein
LSCLEAAFALGLAAALLLAFPFALPFGWAGVALPEDLGARAGGPGARLERKAEHHAKKPTRQDRGNCKAQKKCHLSWRAQLQRARGQASEVGRAAGFVRAVRACGWVGRVSPGARRKTTK